MNKQQQLIWLRRLREDLRLGDMEKLASDADEMGLEALLDPDFLTLARRHNAHQVVILIATLGQANTDETEKYIRLLAIFQFLTGVIDLNTAAELSSAGNTNSISFYKEVLKTIVDKQYKATFTRTSASTHDLEFSIGLLIDQDRSTTAIELLKLWTKIDHTALPWLKTCKELASRAIEVNLRSEAFHLAQSIEKIIGLAPKSQEKVIQEMRAQWSEISLKSQNSAMALKSTKAALANDQSQHLILNYAKALILNNSYSQAIEEIEKLIIISINESTTTNLETIKSGMNDFDVSAARETLVSVNKILKEKGLKPFIISGTLLGYARSQEILPHDKDIDFGIIGWENQFAVAQALITSGHFKFDLAQLTGKNRYLISGHDLKTGIAVDFFLFHENTDHYIHGIDFDVGFTQNYKFSKFELAEVNFLGDTFYVPNDIDKNLSENYGDWKTPDPDYVVTLESPALINKNDGTRELLIHLELLRNIKKNINSQKTKKILEIVSGGQFNHLKAEIEKKISKKLNPDNWLNQLTKKDNYE
jgi:hypothetical protein